MSRCQSMCQTFVFEKLAILSRRTHAKASLAGHTGERRAGGFCLSYVLICAGVTQKTQPMSFNHCTVQNIVSVKRIHQSGLLIYSHQKNQDNYLANSSSERTFESNVGGFHYSNSCFFVNEMHMLQLSGESPGVVFQKIIHP